MKESKIKMTELLLLKAYSYTFSRYESGWGTEILFCLQFQVEDNENVNSNSHDSDPPLPESDLPTDKSDSDDLLISESMPPALHRNKTSISPGLQRILDGKFTSFLKQ